MQRSHGQPHTHDQEPHVGDSRLTFNTTSVNNSPEAASQIHIQAPYSDPNRNSYIHHHHQLLQQSDQTAEEDQSYSMDDFFEHVLSMPSWSEVGSMAAKSNWDINSLDPLDQTAPKLFKAALMPLLDHDPVEAAPHLMTTQRAGHQAEGSEDIHTGDGLQFQSDMHTPPSSRILANQESLEPENAVSGLLSLLRMPEEAITGSLSLQSDTFLSVGGNTAAIPMPGNGNRRRSMGSSESEGSARQQQSVDYLQSSSPVAHSRQQPYVGTSLPLSLAQAKSEALINVPVAEALTNEALAFGKRYRSGEDQTPAHDHSSSATQEIQGAIFTPYGGAKANHMQATRSLGQQSHKQGLQSGQAIPVQAFGGQGTITHPHTVNAHTGASRPRVRARRGQATDPHSIAERLRRERIADRMKWLQELVPNANKTDKASMLDEIIDYVKFLQLQVKVLSMSRMGGAGVLSPFVSDLPCETTTAGSFECGNLSSSSNNGAGSQDVLTEREVARLMEVDMGSAMQFLQSKGLCLMPITLATAISSKSMKSSFGLQADKNRTELSIASMSASSGPGTSSAAASPGGSGTKLKPTGISKSQDFIENTTERSNDISQTSRSPKGVVAGKNNEDVTRRTY